MKIARKRLVGEGDDQIENWLSPIDDYNNVISICDFCNESELNFPFSKFRKALAEKNITKKLAQLNSFVDTTEFLKILLSPYLQVSYFAWGGESPGRSGVVVRAYLELGHSNEVRKILRISDDFIADWLEFSGVNAEACLAQAKRGSEKQLKLEKDVTFTEAYQTDQIAQEKLWESKLFDDIVKAVNIKSAIAFCKFNFLVHNGIIFYLNRGWWHTTKGSIFAVAEKLENTDKVIFVRCDVEKTSFGWIPHFGRTREEEIFVGWRESGIEVVAPAGWTSQLLAAMQASK